ncbi:MAG TPA: cytochrome o ubiquinol oxidase subunit IV [Candidatus Saccharimonadales bacterium]|nr:cytochrome o ubiquinol oxidase subunit IV [Candidatus Saccharimonadales bacterium]
MKPAYKSDESSRSLLRTYVTGFVLSIILTLVVYGFVDSHVNSGHLSFGHHFLIEIIFALAVVQLVVQLVFFLHLGRKGQRWNLSILGFATIVVLILVIGSLWIMSNLDYNMMHHPSNVNEYLKDQDSL